MDRVSPQERSRIMSLVRSRDTTPEMTVRRLVHGLGYRYRLHVRGLPGCPDLVFPSRRKIIFVHGCFWHRHRCRRGRSLLQTRATYWREKLESNRRRDEKQRRKLRRAGWRVLTLWECQLSMKKLDEVANRISKFLDE